MAWQAADTATAAELGQPKSARRAVAVHDEGRRGQQRLASAPRGRQRRPARRKQGCRPGWQIVRGPPDFLVVSITPDQRPQTTYDSEIDSNKTTPAGASSPPRPSVRRALAHSTAACAARTPSTVTQPARIWEEAGPWASEDVFSARHAAARLNRLRRTSVCGALWLLVRRKRAVRLYRQHTPRFVPPVHVHRSRPEPPAGRFHVWIRALRPALLFQRAPSPFTRTYGPQALGRVPTAR